MKKWRRQQRVARLSSFAAHANGVRPVVEPPRTPTGECPLCYSPNPYTVSVCASCGLPLPWADEVLVEPEACGYCHRCGEENPFSLTNCQRCSARLPWSNAVKAARLQAESASEIYLPPPATSPAGRSAALGLPKASLASFQEADPATQAVQVVSFVVPPMGFVAYVNLLTRVPGMAYAAAGSAIYGLYTWGGLVLFWLLMSFVGAHRTSRYTVPHGTPNYMSKTKSGSG